MTDLLDPTNASAAMNRHIDDTRRIKALEQQLYEQDVDIAAQADTIREQRQEIEFLTAARDNLEQALNSEMRWSYASSHQA